MPVKHKVMPRSIVVEYDPRREMLRKAGLAVLLLAALAVGIFLGRGMESKSVSAPLAASHLDAAEEIELEQRVVNAETAADIDRRALDELRSELASRRGEAAELNEAVRFYRNLMAPGEVERPVSVGAFELTPNNLPGRFHYRIVIQQTAKKHATQRGYLAVQIEGMQADQQVFLDLSTVSTEELDQKIPLQFKYFQSIEGDMDVPEGFTPTGARLVINISSPKKLTIENQIPWQVAD